MPYPLPPSHFLQFIISLGWHHLISTDFLLAAWVNSLYVVSLPTGQVISFQRSVLMKPQSSTATFELRLCRWGRYQKKTSPSKLKVNSSSCHLKNICICFSREVMSLSLTDILDFILLVYQCAPGQSFYWCQLAFSWVMARSDTRALLLGGNMDNTPLFWRLKGRSISHAIFFSQGLPPSPSLLAWV